jgi:hypothetical protein
MSQESRDDMRPEYDIRGGVRGKYLARYQRWAGITTADGVMKVNMLSTGEPSAVKIVMTLMPHDFYLSSRERRISPEVATRSA